MQDLFTGGGTRTHNLRINSPIRHRSLTWKKAKKTPLSRAFTCSLPVAILHRFSPNRVLGASWAEAHETEPEPTGTATRWHRMVCDRVRAARATYQFSYPCQ